MHDYEDTFFAHTVITFLTLLKPRQRYTNVQSIHFITKFYFAIFEKKGERKSYLDQEPVSRSPAKAFKPWLGLDTNHPFCYPVERTYFRALGPVVRTPISTDPGLNFNPGFFFFLSKAHSRIIFSIFFRISNHQIVERENSTELAFKALISEFEICTNPGLS